MEYLERVQEYFQKRLNWHNFEKSAPVAAGSLSWLLPHLLRLLEETEKDRILRVAEDLREDLWINGLSGIGEHPLV